MGGDTVGGHCRRECRTIEKACAGVVDDIDELGEYLLSAAREGKSAGTVAQRVCVKMAGRCTEKELKTLRPLPGLREDQKSKGKIRDETLNLYFKDET